ncbi:MAG TPA: hypothetical protein VNO43_11105 [Candidatus Eisenbacteria bacterium]|nr:hypothetical protein [Candidatus Eisenbacteria bacterium]
MADKRSAPRRGAGRVGFPGACGLVVVVNRALDQPHQGAQREGAAIPLKYDNHTLAVLLSPVLRNEAHHCGGIELRGLGLLLAQDLPTIFFSACSRSHQDTGHKLPYRF